MSVAIAERTIRELVRERGARVRVFEEFGIDYCCGGDRTLERACAAANLDVAAVARRLAEADAADSAPGDATDWATAPLADLADHIITAHHDYLRRELPRLAGMADRVVNAHGLTHPEMVEARQVFRGLAAELSSHTMKEEQVLFPLIKRLEQSQAEGAGAPDSHCGSVANPIRVMEHEHDDAGAALARLRELTSDFTPPDDACGTFRGLLAGLHELESDLHLHIHKENNILFPRALELEAVLCGVS